MIPHIPRQEVKIARHPIGAGGCYVRHRSGLILGEILRWPDGVWVAYAGEPSPRGVSEKSGEGATREEAVGTLLDVRAHMPSALEIRSGSTGERIRDATEDESRAASPDAWAWWDRVKPIVYWPQEQR